VVQVIPLSSPTAFNLLDATVAEINQALEFGALTSEQLVQLYLNRITAYDFNAPVGEGAQPLNTILALNQNVLASARGLDEERRQGNVKSLLHGIPVLLKDNIDTADQPTTAGFSGASRFGSPRRCLHHQQSARCRSRHLGQSQPD
jgi:amidase